MQNVLVTGAAGFIGFHLTKQLVANEYFIVGLDNINDYYSKDLKYDRLSELGIERRNITYNGIVCSMKFDHLQFIKADLEDKSAINSLFEKHNFDIIIHLAAQAGVRHSLKKPYSYINSNITGFLNILEAARDYPVDHLIYASSSSVYGANTNTPFSTSDNVDHPVSLYAATKKSNELMAHAYSSLYDIPSTGLRFFTVYGPWGRPDMAYFLFTEAILRNNPIKIFNYGKMERDFTYIDDIVKSMMRLIPKAPSPNEKWSGDNPDPATSFAPYRIFNIGSNTPIKLMNFINEIEQQLNIEAKKKMMDMQPGDMAKTWAKVDDLFEYIDFKPRVGIQQGVEEFIQWYKKYFDESL